MKVLFDTNVIEYIITRNVKDFGQSPIPAVIPNDFLRKAMFNA